MKPVTATAWINALRSGKYTQISGSYIGTNPNEACALGVLLLLAFDNNIMAICMINASSFISGVLVSAGFSDFMGLGREIVEANDFKKHNFLEIADMIESHFALNSNARLVKEESQKPEETLVTL